MTTVLADFIRNSPLASTHEHLDSEPTYTKNPPDILRNLFYNYVPADLVVAGADPTAVQALLDANNPDIRGRFQAVEQAWQAVRFTGYGEAVRIIASEIYGLHEITADGLETAHANSPAFGQPGERLRILRDVAKLDHVQTDHFQRTVPIDSPGPDFFLYDISWAAMCSGTPDLGPLAAETGVTVTDLASLQEAMEEVFQQNAARAVAVKAQHAYNRTLRWQQRSDAEGEAALAAYLADPDGIDNRLPATADLVLLAGNVMIFTDPGTEGRVLANLAARMGPGAILVLSLIHISEPTRLKTRSRMPSSA